MFEQLQRTKVGVELSLKKKYIYIYLFIGLKLRKVIDSFEYTILLSTYYATRKIFL